MKLKFTLSVFVNACYRPYYDLIFLFIYICIIIDLTVNDSSVHKLVLSLKNNLELHYQGHDRLLSGVVCNTSPII